MTTEEKPAPAKLAAIHPFMVEVGETYVTVRRGERWMGYPTGTQVDLVIQEPDEREAHSQVVGTGVIQRRIATPFNLIEARHIEMEHELTSRLYSGLLESMRRAYGDDFMQDETVTVVFYTVTEFDEELQAKFLELYAEDDEDPIVYTAGDKRALFGDMPTERGTSQTMNEEFTASEKALEAAKINPVLEGQEDRAKTLGRAIQSAHVDHGLAGAEEEARKAAEAPEPVQDENFGC